MNKCVVKPNISHGIRASFVSKQNLAIIHGENQQ